MIDSLEICEKIKQQVYAYKTKIRKNTEENFQLINRYHELIQIEENLKETHKQDLIDSQSIEFQISTLTSQKQKLVNSVKKLKSENNKLLLSKNIKRLHYYFSILKTINKIKNLEAKTNENSVVSTDEVAKKSKEILELQSVKYSLQRKLSELSAKPVPIQKILQEIIDL